MITPLQTLESLRPNYPTPMTKDQLGEMLNRTAWIHRFEGYGLLSKPQGNNCRQPITGKLIATDILTHADTFIHYDCLKDATGVAEPIWQNKGPFIPTAFVSPVDPTITIPLPPMPIQPYPDENTWWKQFENDVKQLYAAKGRIYPDPNDQASLRWHGRTAYDIGAGMEKEKSKEKHLKELKQALGL